MQTAIQNSGCKDLGIMQNHARQMTTQGFSDESRGVGESESLPASSGLMI